MLWDRIEVYNDLKLKLNKRSIIRDNEIILYFYMTKSFSINSIVLVFIF
jgi:hypothetical protein